MLLFFLGCNYRTKLTFEMIKWQNKEIFIPQNLQAFIYGKDTIINYHNNKYNILNYIDTSGLPISLTLFVESIKKVCRFVFLEKLFILLVVSV